MVRINEIADKGSDGVCEGEDWIRLNNDSPNAVQLDGYVLHDDQYPENAEKNFTFAAGTVLAGNAYDVLCCDGDNITNQFKVGKSDTVALLGASGNVVSTSGKLPGLGEENVTYALNNALRGVRADVEANAGRVERDQRRNRRRTCARQNAEGRPFLAWTKEVYPCLALMRSSICMQRLTRAIGQTCGHTRMPKRTSMCKDSK